MEIQGGVRELCGRGIHFVVSTSPGGATACSQGREPLGTMATTRLEPQRGNIGGELNDVAPLGLSVVVATSVRGLTAPATRHGPSGPKHSESPGMLGHQIHGQNAKHSCCVELPRRCGLQAILDRAARKTNDFCSKVMGPTMCARNGNAACPTGWRPRGRTCGGHNSKAEKVSGTFSRLAVPHSIAAGREMEKVPDTFSSPGSLVTVMPPCNAYP
jgi:hypothetical protein